MSGENELYPGLDDELDAAFRRNSGEDLGGGAPATLEEVVQEEIAPETSESTANTYERKFEALEQEVGRVIDIDDLKQVLDEFRMVVMTWLGAKSESSKLTIEEQSEAAKSRILKSAEEALQRITNAGLGDLYSKVETTFSQGRPTASIIELESNASGQNVQDIRKALDKAVLEQAEISQRLGKPSAARNGIKSYASDDLFKSDMEQALDLLVLVSAMTSEDGAKPTEARNTIDSYASSQESATIMRTVLDGHVYRAAETMQRENKPSAARSRIEDASRIDIEGRMRQALDIFVLQQAEQLKNDGKPASAKELVNGKASSPLVRSKMAEVLQL